MQAALASDGERDVPCPAPAAAFVEMVKAVLGLPSCVGYVLFDKLAPVGRDVVTLEEWERWVGETGVMGMARETRLFHALRKGDKGITKADLEPMVRAVINTHPGLEFLKETPEFQDRYQETVIHRIFYLVNRSDSGEWAWGCGCREVGRRGAHWLACRCGGATVALPQHVGCCRTCRPRPRRRRGDQLARAADGGVAGRAAAPG